MKLSDILTVLSVKTMFGKRTGKYTASLATITESATEGSTSEEAVTNLFLRLTALFRFMHYRHYAFSKSGKTVFVLYHNFHGWGYDIVKSNEVQPSSCLFGEGTTEQKARESMMNHAAQYEN